MKIGDIEFTRVNNDINGNPRYVFHFLALITDNDIGTILDKYELAVYRAKDIGGRRYRGKDYGGGIVIQSYNLLDDYNHIVELMKRYK